MKLTLITAISIFALSLCAAGQVPDTLWTGLYLDGYESYGYSVKQTTDDGFILAGYNKQPGSATGNAFLARSDVDGNRLWMGNYGGSAFDNAESVVQTADGGFLTAGATTSFSSDGMVYTVRTDESGDTLWTRTFGESGLDYYGSDATATIDSCYLITGNCCDVLNECRLVLLKYDDSGELLWSQIYRDLWRKGFSVIQLEEGSIIIAGQAVVNDEGDAFLMKTDENGEMLWFQSYRAWGSDTGLSVKSTFDGGFIISGSTGWMPNVLKQLWLIKTDLEGDTLWTRTYGGNHHERGEEVCQTLDGGFIAAGTSSSFHTFGVDDIYVVRTDSVGDTLWTYVYGANYPDRGYSVKQTSDGGFIVAGYTQSYSVTPGEYPNAILIRFEPDYNPIVSDLTINIHNEDVVLNWRDVPQLFFREYRIYRSETPYFEVTGMTPLSVQTENSFTDPGAAGNRYFYRVTVVY